uniref:Ferric-dicitrate binding protein FerR (Iron transport regulator) n=1 Tax=Haloferula luteola TaxID=595692 RepID=A0A840VH59_9BACT|nr:LamG-like jellyroll fold domain-containing protein [Haloferula luteola]MBB5353928.1 ferric-dicitrate binding protein FerR (iron transport regulator) [Haloferula luteola]
MTRRRFEMLVQAELDGTCSEAELRELEAELLTSAERRRLFRESHLLQEMLELESTGGPMAKRPQVIPIDRILREQSRKELRVAVVAAVAVLALVAVLLQVIHLRSQPAMLTVTAAPGSRYAITGADGAPRQGSTFLPGSTIDLAEGTLLLELGNGVRGILQAPSVVDFESLSRLRMVEGRGRFQVPYDARGFTVRGGSWEAVDLGTDFGVLDQPEKEPQVHVFQGRVQVRALTGVRESTVVEGGGARRITPAGRLAETDAEPGWFYESLPKDLPYVHLDFEPDGDGRLHAQGTASVAASMAVKAVRKGPAWVPGPWGTAARFEGRATPVRTDWAGIEGVAPRTLAAWIRLNEKAPWQQFQSIVGWGDPTVGLAGKCELLVLQPNEAHAAVVRLSLDQYLFTGSTDLADGRWHHVAASFRPHGDDPDRVIVHLYVDGREEPLDRSLSALNPRRVRGPRTRVRGEKSMPLVVGYTDRPSRTRGFRGEIDEVFVFEAALPLERIQQLRGVPPEETK